MLSDVCSPQFLTDIPKVESEEIVLLCNTEMDVKQVAVSLSLSLSPSLSV